MMKPSIAVSLITGFLLTTTANTNAQAADDFNTWQNTLAPLYLWGVSIDGDLAGQGLQMDFSEALKDLDAVFTFHYEGAKGNWGVIADYSVVSLKPEGTIPGGPTLTADFKNTMFELAALYRFGPTNPWQLLGGVRYYDIDVSINVPVPVPDVKESVTDFFVGGRYINEFGKKWTFIGRADIGAGDSDLVWNMALAFDYRFNKTVSGFIGYRVLDYDVDEPTFKYQMNHSGPLAALAFHW